MPSEVGDRRGPRSEQVYRDRPREEHYLAAVAQPAAKRKRA
jgi:hypothetical protein